MGPGTSEKFSTDDEYKTLMTDVSAAAPFAAEASSQLLCFCLLLELGFGRVGVWTSWD